VAEADRDGDGIADAHDRCPDQPETVNGRDDNDGCPDRLVVISPVNPPPPVILHFDAGSAQLRPDAGPVLDDVASTLRDHPEILLVEVEGHTDRAGGSEKAEVAIAQRRAETVRLALVGRGIEAGRLRAKGYGSHCPITPQTTVEGRAHNRRAGFKVVKMENGPTSVELGCAMATAAGIAPAPIP
jgi:outer membrane protein OmpA-like peptidoglycan-associated protein